MLRVRSLPVPAVRLCWTCSSVCPAGWTQIPGKEMTQGSGELAGSRVLTVTGSRMEFVINNTEGGW